MSGPARSLPAAHMSGVPRSLLAFTSAPRSSRAFALSVAPNTAASISGVIPSGPGSHSGGPALGVWIGLVLQQPHEHVERTVRRPVERISPVGSAGIDIGSCCNQCLNSLHIAEIGRVHQRSDSGGIGSSGICFVTQQQLDHIRGTWMIRCNHERCETAADLASTSAPRSSSSLTLSRSLTERINAVPSRLSRALGSARASRSSFMQSAVE